MTTPVPSGPTSDGEILVAGAGDARANGVYARCGTQNDAPRWRHVDRSWLCILRDGSSWWIGDERAAREDLYWMDAAAPGAWNVCPCDDRTHRHFKGSAPAPALSWHDPRAPTPPACGRPVFATEECPVCLAPPVAAARAPCGHVACALCLARARAHASTGGVDGCIRCPLGRAPFALEGATHLASNRPLLEALPAVARDGERPLVGAARPRALSNPLSPSTRAAAARGPAPPQPAPPTRQRPSVGRRLRARLAALVLGR